MNDFYLTFPSNISRNEYPNNTQSNFITNLVRPIELKGNYEVALAEINYSPQITTDLGKIILSFNFRTFYYTDVINKSDITIEIKITKNIKLEELISYINLQISTQMKIEDLKERAYIMYGRTTDIILEVSKNHNFINKKTFKWLQMFKDEKDPFYYFVDGPDSDFKTEFESILQKDAPEYDLLKMKWKFNSAQVKLIAKSFTIDIFFVFSLINDNDMHKDILLRHQVNSNNYQDFEAIIQKDFNVNSKLTGSLELLLKPEEVSIMPQIVEKKYPQFEIERLNPSFSIVKLIYDDIENNFHNTEYVNLTDRLAFYFNKSDRCRVEKNKIYIINNSITINNYANIYLNIIQPQHYGNTLINILKTIPLKSVSDNDEVITFFDSLHYVPLSENRLSIVQIIIRDLQGNFIKFEDNLTFVIVKLHFRRIKNE